jgi:sortase A
MKKLFFSIFLAFLIFIGLFVGREISGNSEILEKPASVLGKNEVDRKDLSANEKPIPGIPQRIEIPKFQIEANIESVGLDKDRRMDIPQNPANTAWYNLGPRPGMKGSAVIAGHKDNKDGSPSVFWDIKNLAPGDSITVTDSTGEEFTFLVTRIAEYEDSVFPLKEVFDASSDKPTLNLITCEGTWDTNAGNYSHRVVVYSELKN